MTSCKIISRILPALTQTRIFGAWNPCGKRKINKNLIYVLQLVQVPAYTRLTCRTHQSIQIASTGIAAHLVDSVPTTSIKGNLKPKEVGPSVSGSKEAFIKAP